MMSDEDRLVAARKETHAMLALLEHYSRVCRAHLEVGDDACALMALVDAREYLARAGLAFKAVRMAMVKDCKAAAHEGSSALERKG